MDIQRIKVTPKLAAAWLAKNEANRNISGKTVQKYASDMASGNWRNTHQNAIAFYEDGIIADGQHRLSAVVASGVTVEMFVANGLDRADASAIDQGRARSVGDGLLISGLISDRKYLTQMVSIARLIREVETGSQDIPTVSTTAQDLDAIRPALDFVMERTNNAPRGIGTAPLRAALVTAHFHLPDEMTDRIARVLVSGMPTSQDDATLIRLRNWIMQNAAVSRQDRHNHYTTILRVIHAYSRGEQLGVIRRSETIYYRTGVFDGQ